MDCCPLHDPEACRLNGRRFAGTASAEGAAMVLAVAGPRRARARLAPATRLCCSFHVWGWGLLRIAGDGVHGIRGARIGPASLDEFVLGVPLHPVVRRSV